MEKDNSTQKTPKASIKKVSKKDPKKSAAIHMQAAIDKFEEWVNTLTNFVGSEGFSHFFERTFHKNAILDRVTLYTENNQYRLVCNVDNNGYTYLGCIASTRRPLAGENHCRSIDLPDGPLTDTTWKEIVFSMAMNEIVPLAEHFQQNQSINSYYDPDSDNGQPGDAMIRPSVNMEETGAILPQRTRKPVVKTDDIATVTTPKKRGRPAKVEEVAPVAAEPKKRGRKPKEKPVEASAAIVAAEPKKRGRPSTKKVEEVAPVAAAEPKKRGRKPKEKPAEVAEASSITIPKKRGRPATKKVVEVDPGATEAKKRGRPITKKAETTTLVTAEPKKRGRKPKEKPVEAAEASSITTPKKRGRPATKKVEEVTPGTTEPKKRGRPAKKVEVVSEPKHGHKPMGKIGESSNTNGKKRGRPAKVSVQFIENTKHGQDETQPASFPTVVQNLDVEKTVPPNEDKPTSILDDGMSDPQV